MQSFYIIDCSYHFRACYFALPPIYTVDGRLCNAVYGFASILLKILTKRRPDAIAIAGDSPHPYFRHSLLPKYKAGKIQIPEECNQQIPMLHQVLNAMGINVIEAEGFEADDVIATLNCAVNQSHKVYICSKDKDLRQLLGNSTVILDTSSFEEMTIETLWGKKGLRPEQIPDLFALTGDRSDNIPGVPGIGEKTAAKLLNTYGNLEQILTHCEELDNNIGSKLLNYRTQALLSKYIATLRTDVPIPTNAEAYRVGPPQISKLEPIFREIGLYKLLDRFKEASGNLFQ
jgi:DNA polymerase I